MIKLRKYRTLRLDIDEASMITMAQKLFENWQFIAKNLHILALVLE